MSDFKYKDFVLQMMKMAASEDSPEQMIHQMLRYLCVYLKSDRAYIFERNANMTYDNTYEYCVEGVVPQIDNLQDVPGEAGISGWMEEFRQNHNLVIIDDIEVYKETNRAAYETLKPQKVTTLVVGALIIKGQYVGFFGVDNPPKESLEAISQIIDSVEFIFDMLIRLRDNMREIEALSKTDSLTGCMNRTAMEWLYEPGAVSGPIAVVMCDMNGLKTINDSKGHLTGDQYICNTAKLLVSLFGKERCYRIGGDEFVVVWQGAHEEEVEEKLALLKKRCSEEQISISVGYDCCAQLDGSIDELLANADRKMYEEKAKYYRAGA